MEPSQRHQAGVDLLATAVAGNVLDGVVEGLRRVFEGAGFVVGGRLGWDVEDLAGGLLVRKGVKLRDPASGHVVAARVGLSVDLLAPRAGEGNLWTQVVVDRPGAKVPWSKPARLVSHHLLKTPGTGAELTHHGLFDTLLAAWLDVLEGPNAWDFEAQVRPLLVAYEQTVSP